MSDLVTITARECRRQQESCLYTSTSMYGWLRGMRRWRNGFVIAPIVFGAVASWSILKGIDTPWVMWSTAISGLLAGLFPAIFKALALDGHIDEVSRQAGSFKNLQDRFRFLADTSHLLSDEDRSAKFQQLMNELDELRTHSTTPPERFFKAAQKKVKSGDYEFDNDQVSPD